MKSTFFSIIASSASLVSAIATGFRTVGSSGSSAQMVFVPPYTDTVVFIDNYHANYGGPGYNPFQTIAAATHSEIAYVYDGTNEPVFGTEFNLSSNTIRPLKPLSNTFCSAGQFFPNGTLLNLAGAEAGDFAVAEGFDKLRTYNPGPCNGECDSDWVEQTTGLQVYRWYPSAQTMIDGSILIVGGSNVGGLVLNEATINVPTYEIVHVDGIAPKAPVTLPILEFTEEENLVPGKSYNLYPILHLMPNTNNANEIFTIAGNSSVIWDYGNDHIVTGLPDTPLQPRTFPSSASSVLLPLEFPLYSPTILVCGGSSGDMPDPQTLADCYTIKPQEAYCEWEGDDDMPNGPQVMSDPILLPDGKVLLLGGAQKGSAGGFQADDPVLSPILYDPKAATGSRWTTMPSTTIPRLYHSSAVLLPSGEVIVAGSNPSVSYSATGSVSSGWPAFYNNGHIAALNQQQNETSHYPTEYRVEIFAPPYMESTDRPIIHSAPTNITYGTNFAMNAGYLKGAYIRGDIQISLIASGFHTHGMGMGMRSVLMGFEAIENSRDFTVYGPRDSTVMPPGIYLLFITSDDIPSEGRWISLA